MEEQNKKEIWSKSEIGKAIWTGIVIFILIVFAYFLFYSILDIQSKIGTTENKSVDNSVDNFVLISKLKQIPLEANAIFIWDVYNQKEIFSKNPEMQLPLASLSKAMTALVASDYEDKNIIVKIDEENLKHDGNNGLVDKERWNLKDLLDFTLLSSSNDGANAVASAIRAISKKENEKTTFTDLMNKKARELNLKQTYFLNESGLDVDETYLSGSYGSARDITMLFDYIIKNKPQIFEATSYKNLSLKSEDKIHNTENTNEIINEIPFVIASKTGYTDLAGGNLVTAFDNGMMRPIIVSILGSSREGRFKDMKNIVDVILQPRDDRE